MNKQTKLYLGLAALGLAGFLFWKSTSKTKIQARTPEGVPIYPAGLQEGSFVKGTDATTYMLKEGKKLPITYAWWMANEGDFSKVIVIQDSVIDVIPTGDTL